MVDQGMDPGMAAQALSRGVSLEEVRAHRSRQITERLLRRVDLIVVMEASHRRRIALDFHDVLDRCFTLGQVGQAARALSESPTPELRAAHSGGDARALIEVLAKARPVKGPDVADPYRRGDTVCARVAQQIDEELADLLPILTSLRG